MLEHPRAAVRAGGARRDRPRRRADPSTVTAAVTRWRTSRRHRGHRHGDRPRGRAAHRATRCARPFPDMASSRRSRRPCRARSDYAWYVDPLDGTTNFAHGYPALCGLASRWSTAASSSSAWSTTPSGARPSARSAERGAHLNGRADRGVRRRRAVPTRWRRPASPTTGASAPADYVPLHPGRHSSAAAASGGAAPRRSTCATSRAGASTPTGNGTSAPGTVGGRSADRRGGGRPRHGFRRRSRTTLTGAETAASNGHLHEALVAMLGDGRPGARSAPAGSS